MSVESHSQGQDPGVHSCSECRQWVEAHWHCPGCDDYNLCISCYNTKGHTHTMVKVGLGPDEEAEGGDEGGNQGELLPRSPGESRCQSIQRCIQSLVHACQCRGANCSQTACQKMKRVVQHSRGCQRKNNGGCPVCKQLIALCCCHAKQCQENPCPVPFCLHIKQKIRGSSSAPPGVAPAPALPAAAPAPAPPAAAPAPAPASPAAAPAPAPASPAADREPPAARVAHSP